jgi:hypothetical protein
MDAPTTGFGARLSAWLMWPSISFPVRTNRRRNSTTSAHAAGETSEARAASARSIGAEVSIPDQIGKLSELRDKGALSEEEFKAKKAELLERM